MTQYIRFHQLRIQVSFKIQRFEMMQFSPMFTQEPAMVFFSQQTKRGFYFGSFQIQQRRTWLAAAQS